MEGFTIQSPESWLRHHFSTLWCPGKNCPKGFADLTFHCSDGSISAHKSLLKICCSTIANILTQFSKARNDSTKIEISVPDVSLQTAKLFLQLFYTGKAYLSGTRELRLVKEFSHNLLGFQMDLEFYIAPPKDLVMDVGSDLPQLTEDSIRNVPVIWQDLDHLATVATAIERQGSGMLLSSQKTLQPVEEQSTNMSQQTTDKEPPLISRHLSFDTKKTSILHFSPSVSEPKHIQLPSSGRYNQTIWTGESYNKVTKIATESSQLTAPHLQSTIARYLMSVPIPKRVVSLGQDGIPKPTFALDHKICVEIDQDRDLNREINNNRISSISYSRDDSEIELRTSAVGIDSYDPDSKTSDSAHLSDIEEVNVADGPELHVDVMLPLRPRKHIITTDEGDTVPFSCKKCKEFFNDRDALYYHKKIVHDPCKAFECHICTKRFGQRGHLKEHILQVHYKIRRFKCEVCQKAFGHRGSFKKHMFLAHGASLPREKSDADNFLFTCLVCEKIFGKYELLRTHQQVHEVKAKTETKILPELLVFQPVTEK